MQLHLHSMRLSADQIRRMDLSGPVSPYERTALEFCRNWLSGQELFNVPTSGATGKPKSITITRKQMITSACMTKAFLGLSSGDRALCCLNTDYIAGKMMLVRAMEIGLDITLVPPSANPLQTMEQPFGFTALVPLQLRTILDETPEKIDLLNTIIVGGAPVSPALRERVKNTSPAIYETYGMTETVSHIALKRLNGPRAADYFEVTGDVQIATNGDNELRIKGGITNNRWLQTRDVVELKNSRYFKWLGRTDNVINSGGVKIHPEMLEATITPFLRGRRFFIHGVEDEKLGKKVVLFVESTTPPDTTFFQRLRPYEKPKAVCCMKQFLQTPTGKIRRKETAAAGLSDGTLY